MLDFEVTHGGGVHGEVAGLGYNIISLEVMIYISTDISPYRLQRQGPK